MEKVQSMVNAKESGNEEVWRAKLMDTIDYVGSGLRLIENLIDIIFLFEFLIMLLHCTRPV